MRVCPNTFGFHYLLDATMIVTGECHLEGHDCIEQEKQDNSSDQSERKKPQAQHTYCWQHTRIGILSATIHGRG